MTLLQFVAEIVKALAWPIAILIICFLFRQPLAALLSGLLRLRYKDLELSFREQVAETKRIAEQVLPTAQEEPLKAAPAREPAASLLESELRLADEHPRAAVIAAWLSFQDAISRAVYRRSKEIPALHRPGEMDVVIRAHSLLKPEQLEVLHRLRDLRNRAAHLPEFQIDSGAARDYVLTVNALRQAIEENAGA